MFPFDRCIAYFIVFSSLHFVPNFFCSIQKNKVAFGDIENRLRVEATRELALLVSEFTREL